MSVLLACDLDRTLIYSRPARLLGADPADPTDPVCVERLEGEPVSFMTAAAASALAELATRETFMPVTTRVLAQYRRVTLPGGQPRFAVVANGGALLVDGVPDASWSAHVTASLRAAFPLAEVWEQVRQVCRPEFTTKLRDADGLFCYAVVRPELVPAGFVADVGAWAAERGWTVSVQGRKLYWVPRSLTKSAAVAEVARRAEASTVLAAGDSLLDVDLLLGADLGIHPCHGELFDRGWSAPSVTSTASSGIRAGEEVVRWFASTASAVNQAGTGGTQAQQTFIR